ncbi:hypothetical protein TNCV_4344311 [Trichonephila clavipes]|nr:hypothetical protein TNCV_4344311 [Trichonephila clavipes]
METNFPTEESLQLMNRSDFELSDPSDVDYAAGKVYEQRILVGELSSDQSDEKKHRNICCIKTTLDHPLPSKSLELNNFIVIAKANSWFQYEQDVISNVKFLQKLKMDLLKFKLEIAEALSTSTPTNKSILTDEENDSAVILPTIRSKYYNPPAKRPCQDKRHDMYRNFLCVNDISRSRKCRFEDYENSYKTCEKCSVYSYLTKAKMML